MSYLLLYIHIINHIHVFTHAIQILPQNVTSSLFTIYYLTRTNINEADIIV